MRYSTRPVLGMMLAVVLTTNGFGEETKARWWHFGRDKDVPSAPLAGTPAPTLSPAQTLTPSTPAITPVEDESWFHWPSMPKMTWLEPSTDGEVVATDTTTSTTPVTADSATQPRANRTHFGNSASRPRPRNTWVQQPASTETPAADTSTWQSMTAGTRSAWHKTVDFVTPGDSSADAPVVATETKPSWWHRMWTTEEEDEGPQTVAEFMAQDRLDP
jgi:hypothetical protein